MSKIELLKLKGYTHVDQSLEQFIYNFLVYYNSKYNTTYLNGIPQCDKGRHRSLGDITGICKYYYGKQVTKEEVKEILLDFGEKLVGHFCPTIRKRIYEHTDKYSTWSQCSNKDIDEYGDPITYRTHVTKLQNKPEMSLS